MIKKRQNEVVVKLSRSFQTETPQKPYFKVVIAIPCYNTEGTISDVITETKKYVDEVIVIDDGSTDRTADVARKAGARVISHKKNKGYGEAIKSCFAASQAKDLDVLVIIDGDGQHDPDEIPRISHPF